MIKKGSKTYSIFFNKCPKCHEGKFWHNNNPYLNFFKKNSITNSNCDKCNFFYEIEPGFWFGAMYVSYAIAVSLVLVIGILLYNLIDNINTSTLVLTLSILIIISSPINHFFSRLIWINIFVNYSKKRK